MAAALPRLDAAERRARLALRHHLATGARAGGALEVARDLVALHSTDPASAFLAAAARVRRPDIAAVEHALYERRELLRMLGMRRTMFVVPTDLAPTVQAACTDAIARRERRRLDGLLDQAGIASPGDGWLDAVEAATLQALAARGTATASELAKEVPGLGEQIVLATGTAYAGRQSVATRVLFVLSAEGRIVRGRPRGSWTSTLNRWATTESWLNAPLARQPVAAARAELVRRWLGAFGPGTVSDLRWWTGLTAGEVRAALLQVETTEVLLDGGETGVVLRGDAERVTVAGPWVALLPALDPTVMGWAARDWFLGPHAPALFDRTGNAGPSVWCDGRIAGGWAQRRDGRVVFRLLEDVGRDAAAAVEAEAARLEGWLGDARITPRFRTPLERELVA